jgi:hypothetical protein
MIRYMIGSNAVTKAATEVTYKQFGLLGQQLVYSWNSSRIWNNKKN